MPATDTTAEAAMLPRMIQMVMRVVAAGIMADPLFTIVHMGSIRMSRFVVEAAVFLGWMRRRSFRRAVLRNVCAAADLRPGAAAGVFMLREG
jgi:hypothetical protein